MTASTFSNIPAPEALDVNTWLAKVKELNAKFAAIGIKKPFNELQFISPFFPGAVSEYIARMSYMSMAYPVQISKPMDVSHLIMHHSLQIPDRKRVKVSRSVLNSRRIHWGHAEYMRAKRVNRELRHQAS